MLLGAFKPRFDGDRLPTSTPTSIVASATSFLHDQTVSRDQNTASPRHSSVRRGVFGHQEVHAFPHSETVPTSYPTRGSTMSSKNEIETQPTSSGTNSRKPIEPSDLDFDVLTLPDRIKQSVFDVLAEDLANRTEMLSFERNEVIRCLETVLGDLLDDFCDLLDLSQDALLRNRALRFLRRRKP